LLMDPNPVPPNECQEAADVPYILPPYNANAGPNVPAQPRAGNDFIILNCTEAPEKKGAQNKWRASQMEESKSAIVPGPNETQRLTKVNSMSVRQPWTPEPMVADESTLVTFRIDEHEYNRKKSDCVYYLLIVKAGSSEWMVQQRYNTFNTLHNKLCKNSSYKDKIPAFPPKRINRKSKEVIEERKLLLS